MATLTALIADYQTQLNAYKIAETDILMGGQSYQKGGSDGFKTEMANLPAIQVKIRELEDKISTLELGL